MSDSTSGTLDLREQVVRIDRATAEAGKLQAETQKFVAEQAKLSAEAAKLRRDRFLTPALALAATLGAIAALAPSILRTLGGHP